MPAPDTLNLIGVSARTRSEVFCPFWCIRVIDNLMSYHGDTSSCTLSLSPIVLRFAAYHGRGMEAGIFSDERAIARGGLSNPHIGEISRA